MAHGTFKVLDSDIHIIEPPDLWPRYIDPAFRDRAPSGLTEDVGADFPHDDSKSPRAVESFLRLPISEQSKKKILWGNCAAYYGLLA